MQHEPISTIQPTTEYFCPVHGKIGDEWHQKTIRIDVDEDRHGPLHCLLCLRDLLAQHLPVVEEREKGV